MTILQAPSTGTEVVTTSATFSCERRNQTMTTEKDKAFFQKSRNINPLDHAPLDPVVYDDPPSESRSADISDL